MDGALLAILGMCAAVAAANGANDVSKGVATLAGAGVTRYRTAIIWGVATTLLGSSLSLAIAGGISTVFTKGIVTVTPQPAFALAVLSGAVAWVGVATLARLPVSTTHALAGALIGTGLLLSPGSVLWGSIAVRVALPLLLSATVAYAVSAALSRLTRAAPSCVCLELGAGPGLAWSARSSAALGAVAMPTAHTVPPPVGVIATAAERCRVHDAGVTRVGINVNGAHWLSSGVTCMARGLNDTPKIWAVGAFALVPAHLAAGQLLAVVSVAMAIGGTAAGIRVARRLGEHIIRLSHQEGFAANATTAVLVAAGATLGLPMSTTHVSSGAIAGIAGIDVQRLQRRTLRDFIIAWTVTPPLAGTAAACVFLLLGR